MAADWKRNTTLCYCTLPHSYRQTFNSSKKKKKSHRAQNVSTTAPLHTIHHFCSSTMSVHVSSACVCWLHVWTCSTVCSHTVQCVQTSLTAQFSSEQIAANADGHRAERAAHIHPSAAPPHSPGTRTHTHGFRCSFLLLLYLFLFSLVHTPPLLPFSSLSLLATLSHPVLSPFFPSLPLPVSTPLSDARALAADRSTLGDRRGGALQAVNHRLLANGCRESPHSHVLQWTTGGRRRGITADRGTGRLFISLFLCVCVCVCGCGYVCIYNGVCVGEIE